MSDAYTLLEELGYPGGDDHSLRPSTARFAAGGHYGIEISSVNNLEVLRSVVRLADQFDIRIDRVDECRGILRLPDDEIREMVELCRERRIGLVMSVGPRATYDTGGFSRSANGTRIGYRLRGMRNVACAIEDVLRAAEMGVRGFLVYDEGLLAVLAQMRQTGRLAAETIFKLSVHAGCSNPVSARLFSSVGADTINLVPDLDLPMIAAIRQATTCPLDLFSDTAAAAGGFLRTHDVPEFVRLASPVYIKCGAISQPAQNHLPSATELVERMKQTRCVVEAIRRGAPSAEQVHEDEITRAAPASSGHAPRTHAAALEIEHPLPVHA
jgi:hypothetical protein